MLLALVLSVPAIVLELRRRHEGHPLLLDIHAFKGRKLTDRESFALGLLIHLVLGLGFGVLFPVAVLVTGGAITYVFPHLALYGLTLFCIATLLVFPLLGMGLFGRREDPWIWLETLVSMVLLVLGYAAVVQWFQPAWF